MTEILLDPTIFGYRDPQLNESSCSSPNQAACERPKKHPNQWRFDPRCDDRRSSEYTGSYLETEDDGKAVKVT